MIQSGRSSIAYAETLKLARIIKPHRIHLGDIGAWWPLMAPRDELFNISLIAFGDYLDGAIRAVSNPTSQAEALGLEPCIMAKKHALDDAVNHYLRPAKYHDTTEYDSLAYK